LRIAIEHSACNRFIHSTPATLGIAKVSTWLTCHATPVIVIVVASISIPISISITIVTITTMRIALVIT
jgi:hypothetical protein